MIAFLSVGTARTNCWNVPTIRLRSFGTCSENPNSRARARHNRRSIWRKLVDIGLAPIKCARTNDSGWLSEKEVTNFASRADFPDPDEPTTRHAFGSTPSAYCI